MVFLYQNMLRIRLHFSCVAKKIWCIEDNIYSRKINNVNTIVNETNLKAFYFWCVLIGSFNLFIGTCQYITVSDFHFPRDKSTILQSVTHIVLLQLPQYHCSEYTMSQIFRQKLQKKVLLTLCNIQDNGNACKRMLEKISTTVHVSCMICKARPIAKWISSFACSRKWTV